MYTSGYGYCCDVLCILEYYDTKLNNLSHYDHVTILIVLQEHGQLYDRRNNKPEQVCFP